MPVPVSVLDLAPVTEGGTVAGALRNSLDLARHAEALGYRRFWLAEHHNMPGIASSATAVVIGHVASGTSTIRVGAGGVMLPNHAPLVIAEQFGTLAELHPGRIELGLGRAPGTDQRTAWALRRNLSGDVDSFPRDVLELQSYLAEARSDQHVQAVPGQGTHVPLWILGSSLYGAQLAAKLGLPYAFASHFAPAAMTQALEIYRNRFEPSEQQSEPRVLLGFNVCAAETDEEALLLRTSALQSFVRLRSGRPGRLPPPRAGFEAELSPEHRHFLDEIGRCSAIGSLETVRTRMEEFVASTGADELMVVSQIWDHGARKRSLTIAAEAAHASTPARRDSH